MAKIYKLELYITDYNQCYYNKDQLLVDIERHLDEVMVDCFNSIESKIDWHDDIDLNYSNKTKEMFEIYFNRSNGGDKDEVERIQI